jgi:STE24 endopeptidase
VDSLPQWLTGKAGGLLLVMVAGTSLVWVPYMLISKYPQRWWLYGTALIVPLFTCALVVMQIWVMPLATELRPLTDTALAAKIQALAARCGVADVPLFVGGGSDTVVGLGPVSRIILASHTVDGPEEHILYTASHELKHYVMGDNWLAITVVTGLILLGLWLVQAVGRAAINRWEKKFGFSKLSDPASLPLVILILTVYWILIGLPTFNGVQRYVEFEADRFALELTRDNQAQAMALAPYAEEPFQLNEYRLFDRVFRANHPSNAERIDLANNYRPWANGGLLVYGEVCQQSSAE